MDATGNIVCAYCRYEREVELTLVQSSFWHSIFSSFLVVLDKLALIEERNDLSYAIESVSAIIKLSIAYMGRAGRKVVGRPAGLGLGLGARPCGYSRSRSAAVSPHFDQGDSIVA